MSDIEERIYHVQGKQPREIGQKIGQRIGLRLEENISHYIQRRPLEGDILDNVKLQAGALPWMRSLPSRFQEELEGLAEGAGIPLQRIAEWTYLEELLSNNCSAAICLLEGRAWIARNNDTFVPEAWGFVTIREIAGFIPTISFGLEGDVFTPTGINQERLWLHYNYLPAWDKPTPGKTSMPGYAFIQLALENCRNLKDLEGLLSEVERTDGMLLFAIDGKDESACIYECTCQKHYPIPMSGDWMAGTNHYCHCQPPQDIQDGATNSILRLNRMQELIGQLYAYENSPALPWSLVKILGDEVIERRGGDLATAYANVACPSLGELWYTFGGLPAASQGNWQQLPWPWSTAETR
jgi:hypothetical protein